MKNLVLAFLCLCLNAPLLYADTHTAATCGQDDVMTAITAATDGDVVSVPAGNCTWSDRAGDGTRCGNAAVCINDKQITLMGAGIGQTIITVTVADAWNKIALYANVSSKVPRITGFTFQSSASNVYQVIHINKQTNPYVAITGLRIDNSRFDFSGLNKAANPIAIFGLVYGLIDNNQFNNSTNSHQCILIEPGYACAGETYCGDTIWSTTPEPGTDKAIIIEDNVVTMTSCDGVFIDANFGARYVARYNNITNSEIYSHGPGQGASGRGTQWVEAYNNTITATASCYLPINLRAGSGVFYSNTIATSGAGTWAGGIGLNNPRTACGAPTACNGNDPFTSRCDGNRAIDGNDIGAAGYPCLDQPGMGYGEPDAQTKWPVYEWDNGTVHFSVVGEPNSAPYQTDHIQENRDYYNSTQKPGYVAYAYPHPLRGIPETAKTLSNIGAGAITWTPKTDGSGIGITPY